MAPVRQQPGVEARAPFVAPIADSLVHAHLRGPSRWRGARGWQQAVWQHPRCRRMGTGHRASGVIRPKRRGERGRLGRGAGLLQPRKGSSVLHQYRRAVDPVSCRCFACPFSSGVMPRVRASSYRTYLESVWWVGWGNVPLDLCGVLDGGGVSSYSAGRGSLEGGILWFGPLTLPLALHCNTLLFISGE
jgi:hypothetical protein